MKKSLFQKVICFILSVTTLFGLAAFSAGAATSGGNSYASNRDTASTLEEMEALVGVSSYAEYLEEHGYPDPNRTGLSTVVVDVKNPISGSSGQIVADNKLCQDSMKDDTNGEKWGGFGDNQQDSLYLPAQGSTTWNFKVPDGGAGHYYLKVEYFSCITSESSISTIERKLFIDGVAPFDEARNINLDKFWAYSNIHTGAPEPTTEPNGTTTSYERRDGAYCKIVTTVKDGVKTVTTYSMTQDDIGNSMAPGIVQSPTWKTYYCQDTTGYYHGYFHFYLSNGGHQITFAAEREPVIIKSIEFVPYDATLYEIPTYESVKATYAQQPDKYKPAEGDIVAIQAEFPDFVSDASVYPTNDKTSSATYPSVSNAQLYNVIGKNSYNSLGQWAAYKFTVNSTGLYKMSARFLQSALQGMYICRTIKLSGGQYGDTATVPFMEAYDTQFAYSKDWQSSFLGDSNGNIFEFYFEAGTEYTLYVECSLGSLKGYIQHVENILADVNDAYLRILQLTGSAPDEYRDYGFVEIMPDVLNILRDSAVALEYEVRQPLAELCGTNGAHIATLGTVAVLLDEMSRNDGYNIASNMSNLKSYLGTLGTWINDSKKGTLILDSVSVCPSNTTDKQLPKASPNFFKSFWFEIKSFFSSFTTDYDKMGVVEKNTNADVTIDVWLALGRDQSNIWRTMIDSQQGFTERTGYAVNLKLVTGSTLLPSILSGKGPDVYIGLGSATVINYAIRDAIVGVSGNVPVEGYNNEIFNTTYYTYMGEAGREVTKDYRGEDGLTFVSHSFKDYTDANFAQAAMDTLTLGGISYGLPQTMAFSMLFYRMDVLAQLGQEVPETWDDLLSMLPVLQSNNMSIGVSYVLALDFMLYQKGGNMWHYTDNDEYAGSKIALDTNIAKESFDYVCRLFSDYSFPVSYDAANRFRTGEMPMLVGSYEDLYNKLVVYATEIEGLWEFSPLPGIAEYDEDGYRKSINYDSLANVTATIMLHGCEGEEQFAAWEFMQWNTSAEVQAEYGNKMVALIGPSAKYETGNINAIDNLSWTADERDAIKDQIANMSSIVNYPGSYIIARYVKFAFLDAVNEGADPVEALSTYIDAINAEITRKREEFNLKTGDPSPV